MSLITSLPEGDVLVPEKVRFGAISARYVEYSQPDRLSGGASAVLSPETPVSLRASAGNDVWGPKAIWHEWRHCAGRSFRSGWRRRVFRRGNGTALVRIHGLAR